MNGIWNSIGEWNRKGIHVCEWNRNGISEWNRNSTCICEWNRNGIGVHVEFGIDFSKPSRLLCNNTFVVSAL